MTVGIIKISASFLVSPLRGYPWLFYTSSEEIEDQENIVFGLCNVGWMTYRLEGDRDLALDYFYRALEVAEKLDFKFAIGRAHLALAELFWEDGDSEQAQSYFEKLGQMAHALNYKMLSNLADRRIAEINQKKE